MKPLTPPKPIDPEDLYIYSLRKMAESNLNANRTNLTNLLNLRAFLYKADDLIRYSDDKYAIIVLDIAGFKLVNEFCSRKDGDALLRHISDCLRSYENEKTAASHFRADIFALCTPYEEESELVAIVNDLSERIRNFPIACKILPAFGICTAQDKKLSASNMQDYAFIAQKTIKGKYFTNYAFFDNTMREKMLLEKKIENGFDEAMITDQFQLYIQPKVDMTDGHIVGGEALVRWIHPADGLIPPDSFIPVLEKNTSVIDMDKIIWKKVFVLLSELKHDYNIELPVSINISRLHSHDDSFVDILKEFSDEFRISPSLVPLELTESAYSGSEIMYRKISSLKQYGFLFSMDDFGSGYSTMNMLGSQPVDEIKIDKVFLNHIEDPKSQIIIHHSIDMIHALGLKIVVEGVETEFQRKLLLDWGCRYAQGYLFYKPMPAQDFKELVIKEKN
ncbi:MAG: EAL domain-containing protein [Lachnospiraceae bacterium]|nr:EAL domain-containing protein [Lachnospiraceae bacterium]